MTCLLDDFEGDRTSSSTDSIGKGKSGQMDTTHLGHGDLRGVGHHTRTDEASGETTNDLGDQIDIPGPGNDLKYGGLMVQQCPTSCPRRC